MAAQPAEEPAVTAPELVATIPHLSWSWQSQVRQYPKVGRPGLRYELNHVTVAEVEHRASGARLPIGSEQPVDTLVLRNRKGHVTGLLWHYPVDLPPWERAGNVNMIVRPDRRGRGLGRQLLEEAMRRWTIDWHQQDLTPEGLGLVRAVVGLPAPT